MPLYQWVIASLTLIGVITGAFVALHVNAPARKIILDEIAMLHDVHDEQVRLALRRSIEQRTREYVRRYGPAKRDPLLARVVWWVGVASSVPLLFLAVAAHAWVATGGVVLGGALNALFLYAGHRRVTRAAAAS